jgi:hypothetical protein
MALAEAGHDAQEATLASSNDHRDFKRFASRWRGAAVSQEANAAFPVSNCR